MQNVAAKSSDIIHTRSTSGGNLIDGISNENNNNAPTPDTTTQSPSQSPSQGNPTNVGNPNYNPYHTHDAAHHTYDDASHVQQQRQQQQQHHHQQQQQQQQQYGYTHNTSHNTTTRNTTYNTTPAHDPGVTYDDPYSNYNTQSLRRNNPQHTQHTPSSTPFQGGYTQPTYATQAPAPAHAPPHAAASYNLTHTTAYPQREHLYGDVTDSAGGAGHHYPPPHHSQYPPHRSAYRGRPVSSSSLHGGEAPQPSSRLSSFAPRTRHPNAPSHGITISEVRGAPPARQSRRVHSFVVHCVNCFRTY